MSYVKYHVVHYEQTTETDYDSTGTLVDAYDVRVKTAIGDTRNTFNFKLVNNNDKYSTTFGPNHKVEIYVTIDSDSYTSDDLLMVGVIKEVKPSLQGATEIIHVKGIDYSEAVMGSIVFLDGSGQNVMQIMQQVVNSINSKNGVQSAGQKYHLTLDAPSLKFNSATELYDGDAYPTIESAREFYKTGLKIMEKYLNQRYTEDGRYYWYVSTDNKLVIRKRTIVVDQSGGSNIVIQEAQDCYNVQIGLDNKGVRNFVIWKGGLDPSNKIIMGLSQNPISMVKHGFKPHFLLTQDTVTQPLFDNEKNTAAAGTFEVSSKMIVSSMYPYTTNWTSTDVDTDNAPTVAAVGDNVVVTNETEWVYAFRREAKWQSQNAADTFVNDYGLGFLKVTCDMPLSSTYQVGQLVQFNSERYGYSLKGMRIHAIDYSIDGMTLTLIEDIGTI